jgi:hypothetical protein
MVAGLASPFPKLLLKGSVVASRVMLLYLSSRRVLGEPRLINRHKLIVLLEPSLDA